MKRKFACLFCGIVALGVMGWFGAMQNTARAQDWIAPPFFPPRPIPRPWPRPALEQELQLVSQHADVTIRSGLARTKLVQTFQNVTGRTIEGTYVFPLPEGAAVSGFAMTVNGKRVEAEILEGAKAREIYTGIVQKMRDPATLEFIDRNLIRAKIFPILAGAEQKVELEYSETLKPESGSFRYALPLRLPVGGAARTSSVDIQIESPEGIRAVYSPTHNVEVKRDGNTARVTGEFGQGDTGFATTATVIRRDDRRAPPGYAAPGRDGADRDFVLYYTAAKDRIGVNVITYQPPGEDGYFMLLAAPDPALAQKEIASKDVVFVCDTSGSMEGAKIEQARRALLTLLGSLNPEDRFNIITFSSDTRTFRDGLTSAGKANIAAARDWVGGIKAVGGTNINDALTDALKMMREAPQVAGGGAPRPQQIVFMTDGQPTVGETDSEQILKNIRQNNRLTGKIDGAQAGPGVRARLFVFGVGYDVNTQLLDTLAEDNKGASDYVLPQEDIEQKVGSLYSKIAYPVLTDARLDWKGARVYDVYPKQLPDLFRGGQTVVFGRFSGSESNANGQTIAPGVQLIGWSGGREQRVANSVNFTGDTRNDVLPRLWAMRKVGFLLDDARRNGRAVDNEVKDEIVALSRKFGIVTPFTAGLITEDDSPVPLPRDPQPIPYLGPAPMLDSRSDALRSFARGNFGAAGSSGAAAVAASKATNELRSATSVDEASTAPTIRYIEGKTFVFRDGIWTDTAYNKDKSPKPVAIKFASPEYFALLGDARLAQWLSVGDRALIVLPARTIQIEP